MRFGKLEQPSQASVCGFTLIEAAVAAGLIGLLLVSLYGGFSMGFTAVQIARENERATQILLQKAESIRLCNWTQLNTPGFVPTNFTEALNPDDTNKLGLLMSGVVTIANATTNTAYSNALKTITISLTWTNSRVQHQRQLQTLAAQYGMQNYIY